MHSEQLSVEAPPVAVEYVPPGHEVQLDRPLLAVKVPAPQLVQLDAPEAAA